MPQKKRNKFENDKFTLEILEKEENFCHKAIKNFDCGEDDLNEFFRKDAFAHKKELLAETYYFQPIKVTEKGIFFPVAFVSFLNDSITMAKEERKAGKKILWKIIEKSIPYKKRYYPAFPAVKIGRLGVVKDYHRKNFGTSLINMIKEFFVSDNRTGCRFLTVDAYNNDVTINFYTKNGFQFLTDQDKDKEARIMFFDLKRQKIEN